MSIYIQIFIICYFILYIIINKLSKEIRHCERGFYVGDSRNLCLMKSPNATRYNGRTWSILRKAS